MSITKFIRRLLNKFLFSIDTITTKLLILVLCCTTIPLIVVANLSTDIINQSIIDNSRIRLENSKKIFEARYFNTQQSPEPDFHMVLTPQGRLKTFKGEPEPGLIRAKIPNIKYVKGSIIFAENINGDIYRIVMVPENGMITLTGTSLEKNGISSYVSGITGVNVSILPYRDENPPDMNNHDEFNLTFPLTNYYDKPIATVNLGILKHDLLWLINRNVQIISFIAIISLIFAIIIAALFARKITSPILALAKAAETINLGDLTLKMEAKGHDETAKLTQSFCTMVENLKKEEGLRNNFVATLTHDLKVPMLAENQTVSYLLKETYGPLTPEQREVLELIKSTNTSSLEMIGTLLEVYRYDSGNVSLFRTDFDLVKLMHESVNQVKSLGMDKKIEINIEASRDNIMVKADARDIKRVLHNLVSNSIYHGLNRGIINCHIQAIDDNIIYSPRTSTEHYTTLKNPIKISRSAIISIEDNGVGIAREDMPYLFKRFALSKGRKPSGSGLGLYYSWQVITMHEGQIWAESSEKGGSTFKFTLPFSARDTA